MTKREYDGKPLDMSWQDLKDRPYGNSGETVGVVGEAQTTSEGYVEVDAGFYLVDSQFEVLEAISELEPTTPSKLSEETGVTRQTIRNIAKKLKKQSIVERDEESGVIKLQVELDSRFKFTERVTSDVLVSGTHPLRIPPTAREILAYAALNPTRTQMNIARTMGKPRSQINSVLNEYGDPRRDINAISVGYAESELKLVEERIESLKKRRAELKKHIRSGRGDPGL